MFQLPFSAIIFYRLTQHAACHWMVKHIQCVHKVPSGFWKIVARNQIELAICGLRQITVKLWKFFFFAANRWHKRPYLRFSVSCLWNGDCAGTRALCGVAETVQCLGLHVHQT
jgi:hypothetical protein